MSQPTVEELETYLEDLVRNWERFGRNLPKIKQPHIDKIKYNKSNDIDAQKSALYAKWLAIYPNASWDDVIDALHKADEDTIAQAVENMLSSADRSIPLSSKEPSFENEAVPASSQPAEPTQQGEVHVPESVVDELKGLNKSFGDLATDVKNEIECKVKEGHVTIDSLMNRVEEERAFSIEPCTTKDPQGFFKSIKSHYDFLNPYLLILLAVRFLYPSSIVQRAEDYEKKIIAFKKTTEVSSLIGTLECYHEDHLRATSSNKVKIRINSCFDRKLTMWVVETLIQTLFPIMHKSELPWYEIGQGSLVLSFIATDNMLLPFIVSCARKMKFMRLLGIVSVSIGNVYMVVNRNTEPFSLKNSLIEAIATNNVEVVKFLLENLQVNANMKCSNGDLLLDLEMDSFNMTSQLLMPYKNRFAELVLDIKKEAEEHKMEGNDDDSDVAQVINNYHEQLQRQHNFLNTALLSSQSVHLSKDLQQHIKQYCEGIEKIKREAKLYELELSYFIPDSQLKDSKFIPVSLTLCSNWASCGMQNMEQLFKLVFPSVALEHFQWFRISNNYHFSEFLMIKFLMPKDLKQTLIGSCNKLEEKIAHGLGVFMIEIDDTLAFRGRYDMIYGYYFQKGLQIVKHYKNKEATDLLEQIITQKPIGTSWDIAGRDSNNNCLFIPDSDFTPLMIACCNGNEEIVQLLLKYNADPNICTVRNATALIYSSHSTEIFQLLLDRGADSSVATSLKITALHLACCGGHVKVVETMIKRHSSFIDIADAMGRTPLWYASHAGNLPVVKRLLQEKINFNFADNDGVTPLLRALNNSFVSIANELLKAKADPNCRVKIDESTPLLLAVSQNKLQLVEKLLKMKADPNVINARGESPLWIASVMGNMELVEKLIQYNADLNLYNRNEDKMVQPYYTTTTPLHAASSQGHLYVVERLLKGKADPNLCGRGRLTPLMGAAFNGSVEITERLLQARADPNIQNSTDGETALTVACSHGHTAVIELLLQVTADPNIRVSPQEFTALWRACFDGNVLVVEMLLQEPNIDLDLPNVDGDTPLLVACANGHTEIVTRLLEALADPNIQCNHGDTPILVAIHGGHLSVVNKLLECKTCKIDLNISSSTGETPLLLAVHQENVELVKRLLKLNANPNVINAQGKSPLWIASASGNMELVENLLQANADLNICSKKDLEMPYYTTTTPLYAASREGHLTVVDRLLEGKADPNLSGSEGFTPLMAAAFIGSVEITERLLQAQADPNIQRKFDEITALGIACDYGYIPVVDVLLQAKANPNIPKATTPLCRACFIGNLSVVKRLLREPNIELNTRDKWDGYTPLLIAIHNGHTEIAELLLEAHANPNIPSDRSKTPLLVAISRGHWAIAEQLLEYNADPNISTNTGETPLLVAVQHRYPSPIIKMLLQANADPTISTPDGTSPLWAAVMIGNIPLIMRLLQALYTTN